MGGGWVTVGGHFGSRREWHQSMVGRFMSREMKGRWEYVEFCCGWEYWASMKDDLILKLESKYMENRMMGMYEKEYGESEWYEWQFDTML